jgi:hypothetical protein
LQRNVQERQSALLPVNFLGLFHATEFAKGRGPRVLTAHAIANVLFRELIEVGL